MSFKNVRTWNSSNSPQRFRKLRFDILEDRRVMAGLDVFVFDDLDNSKSFNSTSDSPLREKAIFIDLNQDGSWNSSEPWTVTDVNGIARFQDLSAGQYTVRLVGSNSKILQTFPAPAEPINWSGTIGRVVRVEPNGSAWTVAGNSLSLFDSSLSNRLRSIDFGNSEIVNAVFENTSDTTKSNGFVLTRRLDQTQELWKVSSGAASTKQRILIDASDFSNIEFVGKRLLIESGKGAQQISVLDDTAIPFLKPLGLVVTNANAQVKSVGQNRIAVLDEAEGVSRLTVYKLDGDTVVTLGRRPFSSSVLAFDSSPDGNTLAVSTRDDFLVLDIGIGLPTRTILKDAVQPIVFDPSRDLLITGTKANTKSLVGWNTQNWMPSVSTQISESFELTGVSLHLSSSGRFLLASKDGQAFQNDLANGPLVSAVVTQNGTTQVQIGVRLPSRNVAPVLKELSPVFVNEDEQFNLDPKTVQSSGSDDDGDSLVYLIRNKPLLGSVALTSNGTGIYSPSPNANGKDSIVVQAYDGIDWSVARTIAISVVPVNDEPTGIDSSVQALDENPSPRQKLAMISVQDPDSDSDYAYQISDPRFSILNGILTFIAGTLSFEKEPVLTLPILAVNRARPTDSISQTLTFTVNDKNDPPTGIVTPFSTVVPELTSNVILGNVIVADEDSNARYEWVVSDSRFEVVNGVLILRPNTVLDYEIEPRIELRIVATEPTSANSIDTTLTLTVTNQDDPPLDMIVNISGPIMEKQLGVVVGSVSVIDADQGETYSFSVSDSRFQIRQGTISLRAGTSLLYSDPGYFNITVTATSDQTGLQVSKTARIIVLRDPTPYHNDENPYDVDGDGVITPLDPLVIINYINNNGIGPLKPPGEGEGNVPNLDVDGDGEITPLDILILINKLNNSRQSTGGTNGPSVNQAGSVLSKPEGEGAPPTHVAIDLSFASYSLDPNDGSGPRRSRRR